MISNSWAKRCVSGSRRIAVSSCNGRSSGSESRSGPDAGNSAAAQEGRSEDDAINWRSDMMRITILFGGLNSERLGSGGGAPGLHSALAESDLWFWNVGDTVHEVPSQALLDHARPFE